jgi:predicted TIM-barrel fold metal-dependent hydrolase
VRRYPSALVDYLRAHGRSKVLFGTNYPMIMPIKALEGIDALRLDDEVKAMFVSENARRVFKLESGG